MMYSAIDRRYDNDDQIAAESARKNRHIQRLFIRLTTRWQTARHVEPKVAVAIGPNT